MSVKGNEDWNIQPVTLPILYGRSKKNSNAIQRTFEKMQKKKNSKHTYIFKSLDDSFDVNANIVAQNYTKQP